MAADGCSLSAEEKRLLLRLARDTLTRALGMGDGSDTALTVRFASFPALQAPRAVFVTLWRRDTGELRGCRGECTASQPLTLAVAAMVCTAAFDDPRFTPLGADELPHLCIEISLLSPLRPIRASEIEIGRHGLLIVEGHRRGLLLPQVAVEHGMDREQFLAAVCWKAGLPEHAWQAPDPELYAFETECWRE